MTSRCGGSARAAINDKERALTVFALVHRRHPRSAATRFSTGSCFSNGFVQQHILHATGRNGSSIALRVCNRD